jgi:hypothetical protein
MTGLDGDSRLLSRVGLTAALVLALLLPALAASPVVVFEIRVPQGVYPTIVTDQDGSGLYKLERVAANAYRLVNPDRKVAVRVIPDPSRFQTELGVENCGSNGPDPVPSVQVIFSAGDVVQSKPVLPPGAVTSCSSCDAVAVKIPNLP